MMLKPIAAKLTTGMKLLAGRRVLKRLARRQDGTAAIEFGMVAAPFFGLLFAIIETCFIFFAGQTLENATSDAARLILTGQAQTQGFSQTQFKQAVCSRIFAMFDCANKLKIDVRTAANFGSTDLTKPIDSNGNLNTNFMYTPGTAGEIVVVRIMYEWPVWVSLLGLNLSDMSGNKRLLMGTAAFRNEPYI